MIIPIMVANQIMNAHFEWDAFRGELVWFAARICRRKQNYLTIRAAFKNIE